MVRETLGIAQLTFLSKRRYHRKSEIPTNLTALFKKVLYINNNKDFIEGLQMFTTRAKIHQVDATLLVEQCLNNVVIKVQQHLLNSQC